MSVHPSQGPKVKLNLTSFDVNKTENVNSGGPQKRGTGKKSEFYKFQYTILFMKLTLHLDEGEHKPQLLCILKCNKVFSDVRRFLHFPSTKFRG